MIVSCRRQERIVQIGQKTMGWNYKEGDSVWRSGKKFLVAGAV